MKRKIASAICTLLCCLILMLSCPAPIFAAAAQDISTVINGILSCNLKHANAATVQEWIDNELAQGAGISSEWYILALSHGGDDYDFSAYAASLSQYVQANPVTNATTRERLALGFIAAGHYDCFIEEALPEELEQCGVMAVIFALHLLNNGYTTEHCAADDAIEHLLSSRLSDGGWAVSGKSADVDVTAMALQALAPHYGSSDAVNSAVDGGLKLLSDRQLASGCFSSCGAENPESAAQVITALSALGIDALEDERFIKNGNTILDGMLQYRLADGSFSHTIGGEANAASTAQVFYSMIACEMQRSGRGSLYVFANPPAPQSSVALSQHTAATAGCIHLGGYKLWLCLVIALAAVICCAVLFAQKKRGRSNYILTAIAAVVLIAAVLLTDISTAADYYGSVSKKKDIVGSVTLTISCETVLGKQPPNDALGKYLPDDGIILSNAVFEIQEGDTVYDILTEASKTYSIPFESSGVVGSSHEMAYVIGINHLYEFDYGELSGWMFFVDGSAPSTGCGSYELADGDEILWCYTCSLGEDQK